MFLMGLIHSVLSIAREFSCSNNLSVRFGSSQCKSCSNDWLALLIFFAITGASCVSFTIVQLDSSCWNIEWFHLLCQRRKSE